MRLRSDHRDSSALIQPQYDSHQCPEDNIMGNHEEEDLSPFLQVVFGALGIVTSPGFMIATAGTTMVGAGVTLAIATKTLLYGAMGDQSFGGGSWTEFLAHRQTQEMEKQRSSKVPPPGKEQRKTLRIKGAHFFINPPINCHYYATR